VLRNKKRFVEAAAAYDEAIGRAAAQGLTDRWTLFYDRGVSYERSGDWTKAEADLEHALELKPDQATILNYLGYSWIDRGEKLDQGMKMIEKAVDLRPEDGYIVDSLGWAHYRTGDYAGAVQYLERAVELVPDDSTINDHLGDAYWPRRHRPRPRSAAAERGLRRVRAGQGQSLSAPHRPPRRRLPPARQPHRLRRHRRPGGRGAGWCALARGERARVGHAR
jgi:Flp pilus assembly protein TadD